MTKDLKTFLILFSAMMIISIIAYYFGIKLSGI